MLSVAQNPGSKLSLCDSLAEHSTLPPLCCSHGQKAECNCGAAGLKWALEIQVMPF